MKRVQKMIFKVIGTAILFFAFTLSAYGITVGISMQLAVME